MTRITWTLILVGFAALAVLWRICSLGMTDDRWMDRQIAVRTIDVPAKRGALTDREGRILADSVSGTDIAFAPDSSCSSDLVSDAMRRFQKIIPADAHLSSPDEEGRRFQYVVRGLPLSPEALRRAAGDTPCFVFMRTWVRVAFSPALSAPFLGDVGDAGRGMSGLELSFDKQLFSREGTSKVIRSIKGQIVREIEVIRAPQPGRDVVTTIDRELQDNVAQTIKRHMGSSSLAGTWAVVYRPQDGDVLAFSAEGISQGDANALFNGWIESEFLHSLLMLSAMAHEPPAAAKSAIDTWLGATRTTDAWSETHVKLQRALPKMSIEAFCNDSGLRPIAGSVLNQSVTCEGERRVLGLWTGLELFGAVVNGGRSTSPRIVIEAKSPPRPRRHLPAGTANHIREAAAKHRQPPFIDPGLLGYEASSIGWRYRIGNDNEPSQAVIGYVAIAGQPYVVVVGAKVTSGALVRSLAALLREVEYALIESVESSPSDAG